MFIVLGELENMAEYMSTEIFPEKEAYLLGGGKFMQNYPKPLSYIWSKQGLTMLRVPKNIDDTPKGKPVFFIEQSYDILTSEVAGRRIEGYHQFGRNVIYRLSN